MQDTDFYTKDGPVNLTKDFPLAPADYIGDHLTGNGLIRKLQYLPPEVLALPVALYVSVSEDGDGVQKDAPIVVQVDTGDAEEYDDDGDAEVPYGTLYHQGDSPVMFGPGKMLTITTCCSC